MSDLPPLRQRIVRVIIRMGGTSADAARALGCTKHSAARIARDIGLSFRAARYERELWEWRWKEWLL